MELLNLRHGWISKVTITLAILSSCELTQGAKAVPMKTCDDNTIRNLYTNACKVKRSYASLLFPLMKAFTHPPPGISSHVPNFDDLERAEVLEILSNGVEMMAEWQPDQDRRKKEIWRVVSRFPETNEIGETEDRLMDMEPEGEGSLFESVRWRLNTEKLGGKMRREVWSVVNKCCSHGGCKQSDFSILC